jgi:hypothetical protein
MAILDFYKVGKGKDDIVFAKTYTITGKETRQPSWRSWDGFLGWRDTISEHLVCSKKVAEAMLLFPQFQDLIWKHKTEKWINNLSVQDFEPFGPIADADVSWVNLCLRAQNCPFVFGSVWINYNFHKYAHIWYPQNLRELSYFRRIFDKVTPLRCGSEKIFRAMKTFGIRLSEDDMCSHLVVGYINLKVKKIITTAPAVAALIVKHRSIINKIDLDYIKRDPVKLKDWLTLGIPLRVMYPGLTKKEVSTFISANLDSWESPGVTSSVIRFLNRSRGYKLPEPWIQYIKSPLQLDWAYRHRAQLEKTKNVHTPEGRIITVHQHEYLRDIKDAILVNGPKTAWRRVMDAIKEAIQRKIHDMVKEEKPVAYLTPLPEGFDDITFIDTNRKIVEEGEVMNHCVGAYVSLAEEGKSFIFHMGDKAPDGATFEVTPVSKGIYKVNQMYAYGNTDVGEDTRYRAKKFVKALKGSKVIIPR